MKGQKKFKSGHFLFYAFLIISMFSFFACKAEKGETGAEEEVIASRKIFKSKNFSSEKQTGKFLMAVKKKDFKTIFDSTYYYQMKLSEIKSNNPKVLWEKLTTEYYEARKNAVLKGEKKSSLFGSASYFTFIIEPTKNIRALMNSLNSPCKWKVIETRRKLKRDESSGRQYDVFEVYVSLNYPKIDESPLIDSKLLKERIWSIYMDAKTGLYIRHYYVAEGDVYWEIVNPRPRLLKLPDLIVKDIKLVDDCKIAVTVANIGNAGVPASYYNLPNAVGIQMYNGSKPWGGLILSGFDPAGKLKNPGGVATYIWFPGANNLKLTNGYHTLKVIADNNKNLTELKEDNNTLTKRVYCKKTADADIKIPKRFFLDFNDAYLVYQPSTKTLQIAAQSNVLSYGSDWQKAKIYPYLYDLKEKFWKGFYWRVNTSRKEVYRYHGPNFGKIGDSKPQIIK